MFDIFKYDFNLKFSKFNIFSEEELHVNMCPGHAESGLGQQYPQLAKYPLGLCRSCRNAEVLPGKDVYFRNN